VEKASDHFKGGTPHEDSCKEMNKENRESITLKVEEENTIRVTEIPKSQGEVEQKTVAGLLQFQKKNKPGPSSQ